MRPDPNPPAGRLRRTALQIALAAAAFAALVFLVFSPRYEPPDGDASRYIVLGANLYQHGVLSNQPFHVETAPAPALPVGGPLTAFELALAMAADPVTRRSFVCFLTGGDCPFEFPGLRALHVVELALFLAALGWITLRVTGRTHIAWLAVATALVCRELTFDAKLVLTEPLFLAAVGGFLAGWLAVWERPESLFRGALLGFALAATILVKPVFQAIVPLTVLFYAAAALAPGRGPGIRRILPAGALCLTVCLATLAPFYLYFHACCGTAALADPSLLEAALSHRVAYNAMSPREWLAGWIYYLPDFGDVLAPALFPDLAPFRLGWGDQSYYVHGRDVLHLQARAHTAPDPATSYLIETHVLAHPLWHAATSALLLWRGLFVGKLWGLIALPFLVAYPLIPSAPNRLAFVVLLLPILAVAAIQAGLSVSISRYNLALILPMSLSFAWCLTALVLRLDKLRKRALCPNASPD